MSWEDIQNRINAEIKVGTEIPKIRGGNRPVTKIENERIYMITGEKHGNKKYITKDMIKYAYEKIVYENGFNSKDLEEKFPKEWKQGGCVFSMTGGILEYLGVAKYYKNDHKYILKNNP